MTRKMSLEAITALLLLLFVYASMSKILDITTFSDQMRNQPLPRWLSDSLIWTIPSIEVVISGLLLIRSLRIYGLLFSFLLLMIFTVYVAMVYFNSFGRIPCSCAGVFENMTWGTHLVFNLAFTLLALTGIYLERMTFLQFRKT